MESRTLADDIIPGFVIIAIGILSAIILSLIGKYLGLEWVLIFFLIFFLILNFLLKKPYETYGRQSQIDELDEHNYLPEYHRSSSYTYEENLRRSYYMYSHKEQGCR